MNVKELIFELQGVHDQFMPESWKEKLEELRIYFKIQQHLKGIENV